MQWLVLPALAAFIVIDAAAQGGIALRNRKYVPMTEQRAVNLDLHWLLPSLYALFVLVLANDVAPDGRITMWLDIWAGAALLRFALFDAVTNWRKGDKLFALGSSAWLDRLLSRAPWLNQLLRVAALGGSVAVVALI